MNWEKFMYNITIYKENGSFLKFVGGVKGYKAVGESLILTLNNGHTVYIPKYGYFETSKEILGGKTLLDQLKNEAQQHKLNN